MLCVGVSQVVTPECCIPSGRVDKWHKHHSMACVSSPESLAAVGYEIMQMFVSARDEGNSERGEMVTPGTAVSMSLVNRRMLYASE